MIMQTQIINAFGQLVEWKERVRDIAEQGSIAAALQNYINTVPEEERETTKKTAYVVSKTLLTVI